MRVLIIEDEAPAFRRLQRILEEVEPLTKIIEVIDSVEESVDWLTHNAKPDLIFMDIQLADGLSFEIFESIKVEAPIIFTTAYDEYALKAFKVNSIDYLLKPIDKDLLKESLEKYKTMRNSFQPKTDFLEILSNFQPEAKTYKTRFLVKSKDRLLSIRTNEISYFFTENGVVYLLTASGNKYVFDKPLDQIEGQLDPQSFFRLNRQVLTNIAAIHSSYAYDKGKMMVELLPKSAIPTIVSRERSTEFKRWLDLG